MGKHPEPLWWSDTSRPTASQCPAASDVIAAEIGGGGTETPHEMAIGAGRVT